MKARYALTLVLTLMVSLAAVPAGATPRQTPAERAQEIATALAKDPLYVDPAYATGLPENLRADARTKSKALGYPVYSIILPLTPSDAFQGKERNVLTLVMDAMRKPGLYVVVDGGQRFPWIEVKDVPQLTEEQVDNARDHALKDTGYDAGPTEVIARMYELLAGPPLPPVKRPKDNPISAPRVLQSDGFPVLTVVVAGFAVLVAIGLFIGLRRRRPRQAFSIPPHVAATVAAERRHAADEGDDGRAHPARVGPGRAADCRR